MSAAAGETLPTPILDSESPSLLQQISEEGGYTFTSMATRAASGDTRAAEAARELAWEQLHSGPWHSVVPIWRDAYSMACLHVAKLHFCSGELQPALRALDMGLIMGGLTLRDDLYSCIRKASEALREKGSGDNGGGRLQKVEWYTDFNLAEVRFVALSLSLSKIFNRTADYCFAGGGEIRSLNAWFGPPGTVTPLHHDPHHNILAQVVGKKYIRLYSAAFIEELYPHKENMLSNSSQVDLDDIDHEEFPKISDLEFVDCILEEGEMLYIPPKWWHYVRSLTTSFSVSFWWGTTQ